jgi:NAD(P)-dependent dehydrogenase (short-subunit alcohol dehydrogenase family)
VLLIDQVAAQADETQRLVEQVGGDASVFTANVTREAECEAAVQTAIDRYGKIDILVNNIGVSHIDASRPGDVASVTEADWDELLALNLKAMMLMAKHAVPRMIENGGGSIINIASIGAWRPPGGIAAYDAAKGGVISLTIGLAVEQGRNGIRVNTVMPGRMVTPMAEALRKPGVSDEELRLYRSTNLLQTLGDAWDTAHGALFLASDEARWITGIVLPVDGGFLITPPGFTGRPDAQLREYAPQPLLK